MEYGGRFYEHDVIIHTGGEVGKQKKKKISKHLGQEYGHTPLSEDECAFLERERPRVVFIGTGQHGALPLTEGARRILAGFPTVIGPTPEIIREMEQERRPFAAILHVTC